MKVEESQEDDDNRKSKYWEGTNRMWRRWTESAGSSGISGRHLHDRVSDGPDLPGTTDKGTTPKEGIPRQKGTRLR